MTLSDIKICGIKDPATLQILHEEEVKYVGFVIYPQSPRHIEGEQLNELVIKAKEYKLKTVAVVVDPEPKLLDELDHIDIDFFQFHGNERPEELLRYKQLYNALIIKAFKIREADDIAIAESYKEATDMFLFDAKAPKSSSIPGGNGLSFDWNLLKGRQFSKPWILSGGLNEYNASEAIGMTGATIVDVSSSVESSPGIKDNERIISFVKAVKGI